MAQPDTTATAMSNARAVIVVLLVLQVFVVWLYFTGSNQSESEYRPFVPTAGSQVFVRDLA